MYQASYFHIFCINYVISCCNMASSLCIIRGGTEQCRKKPASVCMRFCPPTTVRYRGTAESGYRRPSVFAKPTGRPRRSVIRLSGTALSPGNVRVARRSSYVKHSTVLQIRIPQRVVRTRVEDGGPAWYHSDVRTYARVASAAPTPARRISVLRCTVSESISLLRYEG